MNNARGWANGVASDQDIEGVVLALRSVHHKSAWERVLDVGRVVFERIIGGNEAEWRSHRGRKNVSLRKLVRHAKCPFKKSALCAAVNTYLFVQREPSVRRMGGITPTHVTQTLSLETARALELLQEAASADWSSRELGQRVRQLRREEGERRGRPALSGDKRAGVVAGRAARALRELSDLLASCNSMSDESLRELDRALDDVGELVSYVRALPIVARRSGMHLTKVAQRAEPEAATG